MPDFQAALALVLKSEGGKSDNPKDPGDRTNQGITQAVYDAWRRGRGLSARNVYLIQPEEVAALYKAQYADAVKFEDLPDGLGYAVFDAAVNSGPARAAKWLQSAVGTRVDGHIGVVTLEAAAHCDPALAIARLCDARLAFLRGLSTAAEFGTGWANRVAEVRRAALKMAATAQPATAAAPSLAEAASPQASRPAPHPTEHAAVVLPSVITPAPKPQPSALARLWAAITRKAA